MLLDLTVVPGARGVGNLCLFPRPASQRETHDALASPGNTEVEPQAPLGPAGSVRIQPDPQGCVSMLRFEMCSS